MVAKRRQLDRPRDGTLERDPFDQDSRRVLGALRAAEVVPNGNLDAAKSSFFKGRIFIFY